MPVSSGLTRTQNCERRLPRGRAARKAESNSRARGLLAGVTASSRSKISASASLASALPSFFSLSAGNKQEGPDRRAFHDAHSCGFLSCKPDRLQLATSSSCWLKARCRKVTMPWFGRDLDSRRSITSVSTRIVSPWNNGLGKRTSSQPRLATAVPSVVSRNRDTHHQRQREAAVDDALPEVGALHVLLVEMKERRVVRHAGEQDVVGFRQRAADRMVEHSPHLQFVKPNASHYRSPRIEIAAMPWYGTPPRL